jgi:hypothetical protein
MQKDKKKTGRKGERLCMERGEGTANQKPEKTLNIRLWTRFI